MKGGENMNVQSFHRNNSHLSMRACGLGVGLMALVSIVTAQSTPTAPTATAAPTVHKPAATGKAFNTPQDAANALVNAAEKYDLPELEKIVGPAGHDLVTTGEPAR